MLKSLIKNNLYGNDVIALNGSDVFKSAVCHSLPRSPNILYSIVIVKSRSLRIELKALPTNTKCSQMKATALQLCSSGTSFVRSRAAQHAVSLAIIRHCHIIQHYGNWLVSCCQASLRCSNKPVCHVLCVCMIPAILYNYSLALVAKPFMIPKYILPDDFY